MNDIFTNLAASLIWVAIGFLASRVWSFYKRRFAKEYRKFTYYRVIRLRFKDRGDTPYYRRTHHSIPAVAEDVFDETWCLNGVQCNHKEVLEPVRLTSSGMVDAIQIMPVLDRDADNRPHTRDNAGVFTFSHSEPSNQLAAVGTMINGLQKEEDWWYATTAQYNGQSLLLIVDFTSLPYEQTPITNVVARLERNRQLVPTQPLGDQWHEQPVGSDLFYLRFTNAQKGDIIKFGFKVNKDLISAESNRQVTQRSRRE